MPVVCDTCLDSHRMVQRDREVPCTRCPIPCKECRRGSYCATTPCRCDCHRRPGRQPGTRTLRPYLSKKIALGLRPAADSLEAHLHTVPPKDRPEAAAVVQWLRENARWYFDSGER